MRNMVLLIDTNVVLDYLLEREPYFKDANSILALCRTDEIKGYLAFHSVSSIWYTLRKHSEIERRYALLEVAVLLEVAAAPHEAVVDAILNEDFADFEDCLQEKCAIDVEADYIVTGNVKDFKTSTIPAVTPAQMLEILIRGRCLNEI